MKVRLLPLLVIIMAPIMLYGQTGSVWSTPGIERKVDSLLAIMTLEEKVGQLNQLGGNWDEKLKRVALSDEQKALLRKGQIGSFLNMIGADLTREAQEFAVRESRLHIPVVFGLDVIHGFRTGFPIPLAEASSWDPDLVEKAARAAASEASAYGINWTFAPMVDIARDPRWGRIAEGSGEDPFLGSLMAAARVRGFQGKSFADSTTILACAKHFAAYGGAQAGRDYNTVDISERTLRDVYLPPFKAAVDAGAATLMSSFNEIGGVPSTANHHLLTDILRGEWGFKGFVVSDYTSVEELIKHGIAGTGAEAAMKGLTAGTDMDMASELYRKDISTLVKEGKVPIGVVDEAARGILRVKFALGLFDNPYRNCQTGREKSAVLTPENVQLARTLAGESIVLLKNERSILPLKKDMGTLAVIGSLAASKADPLGPWHGVAKPEEVVTVLDAIRARVSTRSRVTYTPGCDSVFADTAGFAAAFRAAKDADAVILVVGETENMSGEAASRSELGLPGIQPELVRRMLATGKPLVLVLMNGRPLAIPWEAEHCPAILEGWFLGSQAGNAVADVLFGDVNPSGKLPATFPRSVGQVPLYYGAKNTGRPLNESDRFTSKYLDIPNTPLFPFGYGLSYTTFSYGPLNLSASSVRIDGSLRVSTELTNTGRRRGTEVVQLYVHDEAATITRPVKELKGFKRVTLDPGQRQTVELVVDIHALGFTGEDLKYVVEPGKFRVVVGGNSAEGQEAFFDVVP